MAVAEGAAIAFAAAAAAALVLGGAQAPVASAAAAPAPAAAGRLDKRFGNGGIVRTGFGAKISAGVRELVVQPDGNMIGVGTASDLSTGRSDVAVVRYLASGALDTSFGDGGKTVIDTNRDAVATGAAVQRDGKLLVVGAIDTVPATDRQDLLVLRLRMDGTHDPSFGTNGLATADLSRATPDLDFGFAIAVQPDGRIVVAGQTNLHGSSFSLAVARFRADGRLDASFGTGGVVAPVGAESKIGQTIVVRPDGRIIVGGDDGAQSGGFIARLHSDGRFDRTFGTAGFVAPGRALIRGLLAVRGGGFVAVGTAYGRAGAPAFVARFDGRGRLDHSFGSNGRTEIAVAPAQTHEGAYAGFVDTSGRIVIAGGNGDDFLVARHSSDGKLDVSFGGTGVVTLDLGTGRQDFASAVAVRRDGTIVAAGDSRRDDRSEFALVRLTGAGSGGTRYASIAATNRAAGVRLNWQTAAEDGTRAFSIYRTDGDPPEVRRTLLTRTPVRARGRPARYEFVDRDPPSSAPLYWLQEIRRDGSRTWFGPITPPRIP